MKFPVTFRRVKPAAPPAKTLGGDALLVDANGTPRKPNLITDDNTMSSRIVSINGWPLSRLVLVGKYTGGGAPTALNANLFVFEDNLGIYVALPGSSTTVTPGTATTPPVPIFFDVFALIDLPNVQKDLQSNQPGAVDLLCIVQDQGGAAPNGTYDFIIGPELTTKPF